MQYLLTEEEFRGTVPATVIEPYLKALADFYKRKNQHFIECVQGIDLRDARFMDRNPIAAAIDKHHERWTEIPPEPKDFFPKTA